MEHAGGNTNFIERSDPKEHYIRKGRMDDRRNYKDVGKLTI